MVSPIALQLYTLRETLAQDFEGVIRQVADIGYVGVETAGFPGTTPAAAARLFADLGLQVAGMHSRLPLGEEQSEILDAVLAVGAKRLIIGGTGRDDFGTADSIRHRADDFNAAQQVCAAHGLTFGLHNHWWEFS